jgi:hypothetical protein
MEAEGLEAPSPVPPAARGRAADGPTGHGGTQHGSESPGRTGRRHKAPHESALASKLAPQALIRMRRRTPDRTPNPRS